MGLKVRVHELARELGKENREIVEYLTSRGITGKTAVSLVPDAEIIRLRELYGKTKAPETAEKAPAASGSTPAGETEAPKKKIVRVIHTNNARGVLPPKRPVLPPRPARPAGPKETEAPAPQKMPETPKTAPDVSAAAAAADAAAAAAVVRPAPGVAEKIAAAAPVQVEPAAEKPAETVPAHLPETAVPAPQQKTETVKSEVSAEPAKETPAPDKKPSEAAAAQPEISRTPEGERNDKGPRKQAGKPYDRRPERQEQRGERGARTERPDRSDRPARPERRNDFRADGRTGSRPQQGAPGDRRAIGAPSRGNGPQAGRPAQGAGAPGKRPGQAAGRTIIIHNNPDEIAGGAKGSRKTQNKDKDRAKNDRRGMERADESTRGGRKMNRLPKALQENRPKNEPETKKEVVTEIRLPERITIRDLAEKMHIQASAIVKKMFLAGEVLTVNHEIPFEKAQEIAMDYEIIAEPEEKEDVIGELLREEEEDESKLMTRPPVVCVMGHVDHGKTSLLDAIRDTHVIDREAGGITQHIGAYMVTINGQKITFLDTPGHEAFTAMRMRGANSTDIAVLVVAADDGVMPQTIEAINHAKAAGVEIIVAINKIDKPNINIDRVKQELSDQGLVPEEWGGPTIFCPVSAKTHEGIDNLLEMILLAAEVKELRANPNRNARGLVLEAKLDRGRGPVATILVQKGTLRQGDFIACGACYGKVRAMNDDKGKSVRKATPSMPVEIIGLSAVPNAGEVLVALDSDKEAKAFAATFVTENKKTLLEATQTQMSLSDLFERIQEGNLKELPIVVKADVQGSVEAVTQSLLKLSNDEIVVKVIHGAVGNITESDINLAAASGALVIGFNVRPDATAKSIAEQNNVEIHTYSIIYQIIDDVERAIKGMKATVYEEKILGHAQIRMIFKASGVGNIAGSYVTDGTFERNCKIRIFHGKDKIYEGALASLKRFKDDVKEVREGYECGLVFDNFGDFEVDDTVEAYKMVAVED